MKKPKKPASWEERRIPTVIYGPPSEMDEDTAMYENDPRLPAYLPGDAPQEVECLEEES